MNQRAILWLAVSTAVQATDDKASLPVQEAEAREACQQNGWKVIDVLRVPGHSRDYIDIHECARDMRAEGIDAFDRLLQHWEQRDFDILVVRDGSRFARTQALHAYVVERTIRAGANIYLVATNELVTAKNQRTLIMIGGFVAASEMDTLRQRHRIGTDALVERGLPVNAGATAAHRIIRDPGNGRVIGIELNPERRQEWLHLAELVLEGVPYLQLAQEMFNRFGYASPLGKPYHSIYYHRLLHTPSFWGHGGRRQRKQGRWAWDENEPLPSGVTLKRNSHEPVYTGELAERVKAELRRRTEIRGKASPNKGRAFVNLFRCRQCGHSLVYTTQKYKKSTYTYLWCYTSHIRHAFGECTNRKRMREAIAAEAVRQTLETLKRHGLLALQTDTDGAAQKANELDAIADDIQRTEQQLRNLITKQTSADDSTSYIYDELIDAQAGRLKHLKTRQRELQSLLENTSTSASQRRAVDELKELNIDDIMTLPGPALNQLLHRIMGRYRWYVQDARIVGIGIPPPKRRPRY
jgi:hypothetical protein